MLISFSCNQTATKQRKKYNARKIAMPPSTYKFTILLSFIKIKTEILKTLVWRSNLWKITSFHMSILNLSHWSSIINKLPSTSFGNLFNPTRCSTENTFQHFTNLILRHVRHWGSSDFKRLFTVVQCRRQCGQCLTKKQDIRRLRHKNIDECSLEWMGLTLVVNGNCP